MAKVQKQLSTGKKITEIGDSPQDLIDLKRVEAKIRQNDSISGTIDETLREMYAVDETLYNMGDYVQMVRQEAIGSFLNDVRAAPVVADNIRGYMEDMIKSANQDFNGVYLFGGNQNQFYTDNPNNGEPLNTPFVVEYGESTESNPSGLSVRFVGNNEDRYVSKDEYYTEVVNTKPADIFGNNSLEVFRDMIDMINIIKYDSDGNERGLENAISPADFAKVEDLQKKLSNHFDRINQAAGRNGGKIERLEIIRSQLDTEQIRLKEFRSMVEDTDVAAAAIELKKEEATLQYALQVGSTISRISLFDYLR
jgi:flagellin-like hook-associated protein FlgL